MLYFYGRNDDVTMQGSVSDKLINEAFEIAVNKLDVEAFQEKLITDKVDDDTICFLSCIALYGTVANRRKYDLKNRVTVCGEECAFGSGATVGKAKISYLDATE